MSKEATIIQTYNDEKRIHEYFVKGFDVSESIRVLLKAHKEAYDNERRVFAECKGYLDAEKEFKERISELEAKLAVSDDCADRYWKQLGILEEENNQLKQRIEESGKIEYGVFWFKQWQHIKRDYDSVYKTYRENCLELDQLKHQLKEKNKEIKQLKLDLRMFKSVNEFINNYGIDKAREVLLQSEKIKKQDKIEFAISELENVRKYVDGRTYLAQYLDERVKQLKENNNI